MPMGGKLAPAEIAPIRAWIDQGADWPGEVSSTGPSCRLCGRAAHVRDTRWPANPIDRFILARLEKEDLAPSPQADRAHCCAASA
jgi:hypothetical protein